jgi:hypothetical protein
VLIGTITVTGGLNVATAIWFWQGINAATGAVLDFGQSPFVAPPGDLVAGRLHIGYKELPFATAPKAARPTFADGAVIVTMTAQGATGQATKRIARVSKNNQPGDSIGIARLILIWDATNLLEVSGTPLFTIGTTDDATVWDVVIAAS